MDRAQFLSTTVEVALSLLEKNGSLIPCARATDQHGEIFFCSPASSSGVPFSAQDAYQSVLVNVRRDIKPRALEGVAFCFDSRVRVAGATEKVPALEVEVHYKGWPSEICYFLYELKDNKASVLEYLTNPAKENLFDAVK